EFRRVLFRSPAAPVRTPAKLTAPISGCSRADGVVPFRMEVIALDVERLHLRIADFDALFVGGGIESALDFQAGFGRRRSNQLDDGHAIDEWAGLNEATMVGQISVSAPGNASKRKVYAGR